MHKLSHTIGFIKGLVWGAAAGVGVGLLMAPASGDETISQLRRRTHALREQALQTVEETRERAEVLQARGRAALAENAARVARTAEAVGRTAAETWRQPPEGEPEPAGPQAAWYGPDRR